MLLLIYDHFVALCYRLLLFIEMACRVDGRLVGCNHILHLHVLVSKVFIRL